MGGGVAGRAAPRTATEGKAEVGQVATLTIGAAAVDSGQGGEAFGEDGARARSGATDEATNVEPEDDPASGTGTVGEAMPGAAVDTGRAAAANRTGSGASGRVDSEDDVSIIAGDVIDAQADEMRKQLLETHGQYSIGEARHRGTHMLMFYRLMFTPAPPEVCQNPFSMRECASLTGHIPRPYNSGISR